MTVAETDNGVLEDIYYTIDDAYLNPVTHSINRKHNLTAGINNAKTLPSTSSGRGDNCVDKIPVCDNLILSCKRQRNISNTGSKRVGLTNTGYDNKNQVCNDNTRLIMVSPPTQCPSNDKDMTDDDESQYVLGRIATRTNNSIADKSTRAKIVKQFEICQRRKHVKTISQTNIENIYHSIDDTRFNNDSHSNSGYYDIIGDSMFDSNEFKIPMTELQTRGDKGIDGHIDLRDNKESRGHLRNEQRKPPETTHTVSDNENCYSNDSTCAIAGSPPNMFPYNNSESDIDAMDTDTFLKLCKLLQRMTSEYTLREETNLRGAKEAQDSHLESDCDKQTVGLKGRDQYQNDLVDNVSLCVNNDDHIIHKTLINVTSNRRRNCSTMMTHRIEPNIARHSEQNITNHESFKTTLGHTASNRYLETRFTLPDSHTDNIDEGDDESQYVLGRIANHSPTTVAKQHSS